MRTYTVRYVHVAYYARVQLQVLRKLYVRSGNEYARVKFRNVQEDSQEAQECSVAVTVRCVASVRVKMSMRKNGTPSETAPRMTFRELEQHTRKFAVVLLCRW